MNRRVRVELSAARRRLLPILITGCFSGCLPGAASANPAGAQVVNGQVSFAGQGSVLSITNSPGSIINWQSFSINPGETTRFIQQNAASAVLNRITGQDPSQILGTLQSNGRVFLINPNGILFGSGARVDVNGLVASTLDIGNDDFIAGRLNFSAGDKAGDLRNQGAITTPAGGQVYLIAPNVENSGIIHAPDGNVLLAAGHSVQLVDSVSPDLQVVVSAPADQALNLGSIIVQSGKAGIYGALIRQSGVVSADSAVVGKNGKIVFKASHDIELAAGSSTSAGGAEGSSITVESGGTTLVEGDVAASGAQGKGGEVHILGQQVGLLDQARIDVSGKAGGGIVLMGGDYQGKGKVPNAQDTYTGSQVSIDADATGNGNGGKVVVWADDTTRSYAHISARGGAEGGNGGFVETSGRNHLDVGHAYPDVAAPKGVAGSWLLDPTDITITDQIDAGDTTLEPPYFTPGIGASKLDAATLTNYLETSGSVTIDTGSQGTDAGNITVESAIAPAMGTAGTLALHADHDIEINAPISATGNALTVDLQAGRDGSGTITLNSGIASNGGSVSLSAPAIAVTAQGAINTGGNVLQLTADRMDLGGAAGSLDAGSGLVAVLPRGADTSIQLGQGATDAAGTLGLSEDELRTLATSNRLDIQSGNAGGISIVGALDLTGGGLTGELSLTGENGFANLAPSLRVPHALTIWTNAGDIVSNGAISAGGDIWLNADANIINSAALSGGGAVRLESYYGKITNNAGITAGGDVSLDADKMSLAGGTISNGTNAVRLSAYDRVELGAADEADAAEETLELSNAELDSIHTGTLGIEGYGIDIGSAIAPAHVATALSLESYGALTQQAGATIGGVPALSLSADSVELMEGNTVGTIAGKAGYGDFRYRSVGPITVAGVDGMNGISLRPSLDCGDICPLEAPAQPLQIVNPYSILLQSDSALGIGQSAEGVIDTYGGTLVLKSAGPVRLTSGGNLIDRVAADLRADGTGSGGLDLFSGTDLEVAATGTGVEGIATNNQDISLRTGPDRMLMVDAPVQAGSGQATLVTDNLALNGTVSAGIASIRTASDGRAITVGSTECNVEPCLRVTGLYNVLAPTIDIGYRASADAQDSQDAQAGPIHVAGISHGGGNAASDRSDVTTRIDLLSSGAVTQSGAIDVHELGAAAGGRVSLTDPANTIGALAATSDGAPFSFLNAQSFTVSSLTGGTGVFGGIVTNGGDISLASRSGDIVIGADVNAGAGNVALQSGGALKRGGGAVIGNGLTAAAAAGIALDTQLHALAATNSDSATASAIDIANTGVLALGDVRQSGSGDIAISNQGALTLAASHEVATGTGGIRLTAHSPLTIDGAVSSVSGAIALEAGASNSLDDNLTINGSVVTGGNITLKAGAAIQGDGRIEGASVTKMANGNLPPPSEGVDAASNTMVSTTVTASREIADALYADSQPESAGANDKDGGDGKDDGKDGGANTAGPEEKGAKENDGAKKMYCD